MPSCKCGVRNAAQDRVGLGPRDVTARFLSALPASEEHEDTLPWAKPGDQEALFPQALHQDFLLLSLLARLLVS